MAIVSSAPWLLALCGVVVLAAPSAAADVGTQPTAPACPGAPGVNRPPTIAAAPMFRPAVAEPTGRGEMPVRSGRTVRVSVRAEDPDGDALSYAVEPLPAGATFDPREGVLTWQPTRAQEGRYELLFRVTDGRAVTQRTWVLLVRPNRSPVSTRDEAILRVGRAAARSAGTPSETGLEDSTTALLARDPDSDELTFVVHEAPAGARFVSASGQLVLLWAPSDRDVGEHEVLVDVSDGELRTTVRTKIVVFAEWAAPDYRRWLLLGGGPSGFVTHSNGEFMVGGAVDVSFLVKREDASSAYLCGHRLRRDDCHASHHRFYAEFEVLDSMRSGAPSVFTYAGGYSASLEWNPGRRYLIPHYGVEVGGLVRSGLGHRAQVRPYLGLHLWAGDDVWLNMALGYRVVPVELLDFSGPTLTLRAIVNPW